MARLSFYLTCNIIAITGFFLLVQAGLEFTNIECTALDKSFVIPYCYKKSVNRTYKYISLRVKLGGEKIITNATLTIALLKRANGYKPFLYNVTFDGCRYMRMRSNPVVSYLHSIFEKYSNVNHTCPFGPDDLVLEKLPITHVGNLVTNVLPVPPGDYMYHSIWCTYGVPRVMVKVFWSSY